MIFESSQVCPSGAILLFAGEVLLSLVLASKAAYFLVWGPHNLHFQLQTAEKLRWLHVIPYFESDTNDEKPIGVHGPI